MEKMLTRIDMILFFACAIVLMQSPPVIAANLDRNLKGIVRGSTICAHEGNRFHSSISQDKDTIQMSNADKLNNQRRLSNSDIRRKLNEETSLYFQMLGELSMSMMVPSLSPTGIQPASIIAKIPTAVPTTKQKTMVPSKAPVKQIVLSPVQTPTVTNTSEPQTPDVGNTSKPQSSTQTSPTSTPVASRPSKTQTTQPRLTKAPLSKTVPARKASSVPSLSKQPSKVQSATPTIPTIVLSDRPSILSPVVNEIDSDFPSENPSSVPASAEMIFRCENDGVGLVGLPIPDDIVSTLVEIKVVYKVETTGLLNTYKRDLDDKIVNLAVAGALQCLVTDPLYNITESLMVRTINTGEACTPQLNNTICSILETNLDFMINQDVDASVAAFLSYIKIQENMADSAFVNGIPNLSRIQYISPLPLLPPIESSSTGPKPAAIEPSSTTISASPWTLGAVVAMCVGGFVALWAWVRNRRTRNRRHMQLIDDA